MITMMVVVGDEPTDAALEIAREEVVLQQDAVLQGLVPTLDFALCLGMVWRSLDLSLFNSASSSRLS